jgi:hypothetical protein
MNLIVKVYHSDWIRIVLCASWMIAMPVLSMTADMKKANENLCGGRWHDRGEETVQACIKDLQT